MLNNKNATNDVEALDQLDQADAALSRIYTALRDLPEVPAEAGEYSARFHEIAARNRAIAVVEFLIARALRPVQHAAAGEMAAAADHGHVGQDFQLLAFPQMDRGVGTHDPLRVGGVL